jgi:uncharacterized protein (DUF433 family)
MTASSSSDEAASCQAADHPRGPAACRQQPPAMARLSSVTDPRDLPTYTVAEAARYAHVSPKTLASWLAPRGLIVPAGHRSGLSFWNLVEVWILSSIRKEHGASMQRTRKAVDFVERQLGMARPLIQAQFKTDGLHLFVDHLGDTVKVSDRSGQAHLKELVGRHLTRVSYDAGRAASLYPFVRTFDTPNVEQPRVVVIDPRYGFGRPVIAGTNIRTDVIASRFWAGESQAELADDYSLPVSQIEDAIRAERFEAA